MIPIEISGHSFKGLINYLIAPKSGDLTMLPELRRLVYTANMTEHKPRNSREVIAIMVHYSREDVRRGLMELAKVRGRGREINRDKPPVRHIVLAFPDGALPEKELIKGAVKSALSSLESHNGRSLADHQYAVYLHQDTSHWHVHVVVNLIDHCTGRLADPYRSQQKLQKWAYEWCKTHGFDVCPDRQKKYECIEKNREAARQERRCYYDDSGYKHLRGEKYHIHQYKRRKAVLDVDGRGVFFKEKLAALKARSTQNYQRRKAEKDALYTWKTERKAQIKAHFRPLLKKACALKESPLPFTLDANQRAQRKQFIQREKTEIGRVLNSAVLALETGGDGFFQNFIRYHFMGQDGRRIALFRNQYHRRKLSKRVLSIQQNEHLALKKLERAYAGKLQALKDKHHAELTEERLDWRDLNEVRFRRQGNGHVLQSTQTFEKDSTPAPVSLPQGVHYTGKTKHFQIGAKKNF